MIHNSLISFYIYSHVYTEMIHIRGLLLGTVGVSFLGEVVTGPKCRVYEKEVSLQRPHQGFRVRVQGSGFRA